MSLDNKCKIFVSRLEKKDIDEVDVVAQNAYGDHHWSKDAFYSELSNNLAKYYVARNEEGRLLGFAGSWSIIDEAHITTIDNCYVEKIKYLTLEVRESNIPAIKLYEKYGFKSFGVRKGYYQDNNENALIMWTENIFWDKFKNVYEHNISELEKLVVVE